MTCEIHHRTEANYIDAIAARIGEIVPDCPPGLLRVYALLACAKGERTTPRDVHDAWSAWCCATKPGHPSLIPFEQLSPGVQALDGPYVEAIRAVAAKLREDKLRERFPEAANGPYVVLPSGSAPKMTYTQWGVAYGGEDGNDCAGVLACGEEAEAAQTVQWINGGFLVRREVAVGRWERVDGNAEEEASDVGR